MTNEAKELAAVKQRLGPSLTGTDTMIEYAENLDNGLELLIVANHRGVSLIYRDFEADELISRWNWDGPCTRIARTVANRIRTAHGGAKDWNQVMRAVFNAYTAGDFERWSATGAHTFIVRKHIRLN